MAIYAHICQYVSIYGHIWSYTVIYDQIMPYIVIYGHTWVYIIVLVAPDGHPLSRKAFTQINDPLVIQPCWLIMYINVYVYPNIYIYIYIYILVLTRAFNARGSNVEQA